jgi:hypothetical protein
MTRCSREMTYQKNIVANFYKTRMLCLNSNPMVDFFNILFENFLYQSALRGFSLVMATKEKLREALLYEKFVHKMLMKLTPRLCVSVQRDFKAG